MVADAGIPAGYKQTEVGVIPEDWDVKTLEDMVSIRKQKHDPRKEGNNDFCIELEHIGQGNGCLLGSTETTINSSIKAVFKKNDVLFGRLRAYLRKYWMANRDGVASTEIWPLIVNSDLSIPEYIFQIVQTSRFINSASEAYGTHMPRTDWNVMKNVLIATPSSIEEQTAIATVLSDTDALIDHLEKLIAKKKNIKQGAMQQLLTPKEHWKEQTVFQIADNKKEFFDDGDWIEAEHITDKGIRLIQTGNIGIGTFVEKKDRKYIFEKSFYNLGCKELKVGDLLICRLAEPAGRACVLPFIGEEKVITSVDVTIFRPRKELVNRAFLSNIFSTNDWFKQISGMCGGTTHKRISRSALGRIKIFLPPIEEQTAIATILSDMDTEIEALEQKRDKYTMIKQGMMQQLLTGRIRVHDTD